MPPNTHSDLFLKHYHQLPYEDDSAEQVTVLPPTKSFTERTLEQELRHQLWCSLRHGNDENRKSNDPLQNKLIEALQGIVVLDSSVRHQKWLISFRGILHNLPEAWIQRVKAQSPIQFTARVADFNDNLFYQMQPQKGLQHLGLGELQGGLLQGQANDVLGSYLHTDTTIPQPPHVDYTWEILEEHGSDLQVGFFPLTEEGMFLQVWPTRPKEEKIIEGQIVFVPYGKLLVLPATTIHGGGFRTNTNGNLRFHLYLSTTKLPTHQTNKYTEPDDKSRELSERYVNNPHMKELLEHL
eukprot:CAMPEP_0185724754 /NCGR_PEP_ID=MMETSP1171-20130828/1148_1 /TAXON_ID=374046 /ORGANISM="Helicotheca tamensis, Strain CCMP826" /LENGTH=295 /DNA_ID=CAMNT_0028392681 /DNA_START=156 /DNA_END=1040 /DNA_ORIENTATION=-